MDRVARDLRRPVAPNRGIDRGLRILRAEQTRRRAWQLAVAAAVILAVSVGLLRNHRDSRLVRFTVRAPDSRRVALLGDFNDWNRDAVLLQRQDDEWSVTLRLRPGRYRYSFLADGARWISDAASPPSDDDFNTPTLVVTVAN